MYEMEGPRPVSRHRPADFSASFAPFDHLPGPGTRPAARSRPDHRWLGVFPVPWLRLSSLPTSRGFPQARWRQVFPQPVAQSFLAARQPGFPPSRMTQVFPLPVAQSFLLITQLGVSPPPHKLKLSLCRVVPGFSPGPEAPASAQYRWRRASPRPEAAEHAHYQVVWGFPRTGGTRLSPGPEALASA